MTAMRKKRTKEASAERAGGKSASKKRGTPTAKTTERKRAKATAKSGARKRGAAVSKASAKKNGRKTSKKSAAKKPAARKSAAKKIGGKRAKTTAKSAAAGTALITGASIGIGRELALVFAENGYDLVIVSRTKSKLDHVAAEIRKRFGVRVTVMPADLTERKAPERLFERVGAAGIEIDVLVNNAGTGHFIPFAETNLAEHVNVLELNVVALTAMARLFVEPMLRRGHGRILNVASVAAFQPTPRFAVYGATKAYVLSLTESLVEELTGTGVTATALCPGFTDTELVEHISEESGDSDLIPGFLMLDAPTVAREGYHACMAGTPVQVNGRTYQALVWWERIQPRWLVRRMNGLVGRWIVGNA